MDTYLNERESKREGKRKTDQKKFLKVRNSSALFRTLVNYFTDITSILASCPVFSSRTFLPYPYPYRSFNVLDLYLSSLHVFYLFTDALYLNSSFLSFLHYSSLPSPSLPHNLIALLVSNRLPSPLSHSVLSPSLLLLSPQLHYVKERGLESFARLTSRIELASNYEGKKMK